MAFFFFRNDTISWSLFMSGLLDSLWRHRRSSDSQPHWRVRLSSSADKKRLKLINLLSKYLGNTRKVMWILHKWKCVLSDLYLNQSQQQFSEVSRCVSCDVFLQLLLEHCRDKKKHIIKSIQYVQSFFHFLLCVLGLLNISKLTLFVNFLDLHQLVVVSGADELNEGLLICSQTLNVRSHLLLLYIKQQVVLWSKIIHSLISAINQSIKL